MADDIELPPLPAIEHWLKETYTAAQMRYYARAAVLADRERRQALPMNHRPVAAPSSQGDVPANANTGHGHVFRRPDGVRARCGGPGICAECSRDAARAAAGKNGGGE